MLLIVKMSKSPGLIRCGPPADYVAFLHLPDSGDHFKQSLSPSSASCHCCVVAHVACCNILIRVIHYAFIYCCDEFVGKYIRLLRSVEMYAF